MKRKNNSIELPPGLLEAAFKLLLTGTLALQIYLVKEISGLREHVATLATRIEMHLNNGDAQLSRK